MSKLYIGSGKARHRYRNIYSNRLGGRRLVLLICICVALLAAVFAALFFFTDLFSGKRRADPASSSAPVSSVMSSVPESSSAAPVSSALAESSSAVVSAADYTALYPELTVTPAQIVERTTGDKVVFLTFNEGPSAVTQTLLDTLDTLQIKATFFVTAANSTKEDCLSLLKAISDRGHTLGIYACSSDYKSVYASVESYLQDFKAMDDLIYQATGKHATLFRFPAGSGENLYNKDAGTAAAILAEMTRRGYVYHDWNVDGGDYSAATDPQTIAQTVISACSGKEKCVVNLQNAGRNSATEQALTELVTQLTAQGYRFAPLDGTVRPFTFAK